MIDLAQLVPQRNFGDYQYLIYACDRIDGTVPRFTTDLPPTCLSSPAHPATPSQTRTTDINTDLYTTTMQMVPLLLIALFVDNRDSEQQPATRRSRRWQRVQDKTYALLAVAAFFTSMFVASDVIDSSRFTTAIVISALGGTMTLLLLQIWRRFDQRRRNEKDVGPDGPYR